MHKYLIYDIEALEDIKLAKTNTQIDSEESMEYITGSSIRGAFIYKYIREYNIQDINQGIHREKLLSGGIKFLNAYPISDKNRSIPFPKCYFAKKEEIRGFDGYLEIKSGLDTSLEQGFEKVRLSEFVRYEDDEFYKVNVEKKSNLHINKLKEKNILFRYESISKGQEFRGIIKVEDDTYVDEIKGILEDTIVYIGGSKGSGYGRCRIKNMEVVENNPEYYIFEDKDDFEEYIYLLAMSDIIYRNELGEYKTLIEPKYLCEKLKLENVEYIDSNIETKRITSFNNKWNCHTPQIVGIKAGSVFKYKIHGDIDEDILRNFMDKGIGERKVDGFGRFIILDSFNDSYLNEKQGEIGEGEELYELLSRLNEDEETQLYDIVNRIYISRIENEINNRVLEIDDNMKNQDQLSSSQWGNYKDLFSYLLTLEPSIGISKYKENIDYIKEKRSISYKQLKKVRYGDEKFEDFLGEFISNSTNIDLFYQNFKVNKIKFGKVKSEVDEDFVYKVNLKTLVELCRYEIRREGK